MNFRRKIKQFLAMQLIVILLITGIPFPGEKAWAKLTYDWEVINTNTGRAQALAYGKNMFLLMNDDGDCYISADGSNWEHSASIDLSGEDVCYDIYDLKLTFLFVWEKRVPAMQRGWDIME